MPETTETVPTIVEPILTQERFKRWFDIVDEIRATKPTVNEK